LSLSSIDDGLELSSVNKFGLSTDPHYLVTWGSEKWLRVNYDSGAATSALPVELAPGDVEPIGEFVVADGNGIPNYGRYRCQAVDEENLSRGFAASVTTVHKPLGSAAEFSKTHDCVLYEEGGMLIPKHSALAVGMRREYDRLVSIHGTCHALPIHREGSLYNFYVKPTAGLSKLGPRADEQQLNAKDGSGNRRQALNQP